MAGEFSFQHDSLKQIRFVSFSPAFFIYNYSKLDSYY